MKNEEYYLISDFLIRVEGHIFNCKSKIAVSPSP
jgi:hypothetical protein